MFKIHEEYVKNTMFYVVAIISFHPGLGTLGGFYWELLYYHSFTMYISQSQIKFPGFPKLGVVCYY